MSSDQGSDQAGLFPPQVFVSYAKEDKDAALSIYRRLSKDGVRPWIDVHDLEPGENWQLEIGRAIRSCSYILVLISSLSVKKRGYVQKEIREALDVADTLPEDQVYMIPIKLDECEVPGRLAKWHWVDAREKNALDRMFEQLASKCGLPLTPHLTQKERELRSTLSPDIAADFLLLHIFLEAGKVYRSRDRSGELVISDGRCLEIRQRTLRFVGLFDELFPRAESHPRDWFDRVVQAALTARTEENRVARFAIVGDSPRDPVLLYRKGGTVVGLAIEYLSYLLARHASFTIFAPASSGPMAVFRGDRLVFLAMPVMLPSLNPPKQSGTSG